MPGEARGGAVTNHYKITIENSVFSGNTASSEAGKSYGGAISQESALYFHNRIANSVFYGNTASSLENEAVGGAIYGGYTLLIDDSFINNAAISSATANGGALYLYSANTLIAKDKDVLFEGNYTSSDGGTTKVSNAVHQNNSIFNLNAGSHNIIFNDRITSTNSSVEMNINRTGTFDDTAEKPSYNNGLVGNYIPTWAPTTGTIELNEDMSGYLGTVNLYNGTVKLGEDRTNTYSQAVTPKFFNASALNLYGGTIDLQNKKIDTVNVGDFNASVDDATGDALANLKIDADMSAGTADNFTISGTSGGKLNITGINILADGGAKKITVFQQRNFSGTFCYQQLHERNEIRIQSRP